MELYKFAVSGVIFAIIILLVKNTQKELGVLLSIACSVLLLASLLDVAVGAFSELEEIFAKTNIDTGVLKGVLKIVGTAYIAEFASEICEEAGSNAVATKVRMFGKVTVLIQTLPLISAFIKIVSVLL